MKNILRSGIFFAGAAILVIGAAVWYVSGGGDSDEVARGRELRSRKIAEAKPAKVKGAKGFKKVSKVKESKAVRIARDEKPQISLEAAEEAKLTAEMREIYHELQKALDSEDKKRVFALVRRLQGMDEWPDGIPKSVKRHALNALAWFGASGIAEAVGFLADADPEIRQQAMDTFEQQFEDSWDLGDAKLAEIMVSMAKLVDNTESLEAYYDQFSNMRPRVRAEAVRGIYESGTENAKSLLDQKLSEIFEEDFGYTVNNRGDVDKYLRDAIAEEQNNSEKAQEYEEIYGKFGW